MKSSIIIWIIGIGLLLYGVVYAFKNYALIDIFSTVFIIGGFIFLIFLGVNARRIVHNG